jgi:hypothetical protein
MCLHISDSRRDNFRQTRSQPAVAFDVPVTGRHAAVSNQLRIPSRTPSQVRNPGRTPTKRQSFQTLPRSNTCHSHGNANSQPIPNILTIFPRQMPQSSSLGSRVRFRCDVSAREHSSECTRLLMGLRESSVGLASTRYYGAIKVRLRPWPIELTAGSADSVPPRTYTWL